MNILLQEPRVYIMDITHEIILLGIVVGEQQDGKLFLSIPLFASSMTLVAVKHNS
jgi:hypothetical protein